MISHKITLWNACMVQLWRSSRSLVLSPFLRMQFIAGYATTNRTLEDMPQGNTPTTSPWIISSGDRMDLCLSMGKVEGYNAWGDIRLRSRA